MSLEVAAVAAEAPTLYPTFKYRDAPAAIDFLKSAFGFQERVVYTNPDGTIAHSELTHGPSILMVGTRHLPPGRRAAGGDRFRRGALTLCLE
jgi:uncharacterized glyoxalase superfamily protein PhnB